MSEMKAVKGYELSRIRHSLYRTENIHTYSVYCKELTSPSLSLDGNHLSLTFLTEFHDAPGRGGSAGG